MLEPLGINQTFNLKSICFNRKTELYYITATEIQIQPLYFKAQRNVQKNATTAIE